MNQICIYDMYTKQDDFSGNGIRILTPISCEITEELNGTYELVMEHPVDEYGAWKNIVENNILKVMGQLFPIYRVVTNFDGNSGSVVAYARHIFYVLSDYWFNRLQWNAPTGQVLLDNLMSYAENHLESGMATYMFTAKSDIEAYTRSFSSYIEQQTLVNVILDTENSMVEVMEGEIYRDNFYFSVNKRKENAKDNAFSICVGLNLAGIERDVDFSSYMTYFTGYSEGGLSHTVSNWDPKVYPRNVVRSLVFDMENESQTTLNSLTEAYFARYNVPDVTITVSVIDISNNPDLSGVQWGSYNVGDTGYVYDERLDLSLKMKIIGTITDGITGEVTSVTFKSIGFKYSRPYDYENFITEKIVRNAFGSFSTSAEEPVLDAEDRKFMVLNDGNVSDYTSEFTGDQIDEAVGLLLGK